jgi:hypothetical protein
MFTPNFGEVLRYTSKQRIDETTQGDYQDARRKRWEMKKTDSEVIEGLRACGALKHSVHTVDSAHPKMTTQWCTDS